MKSKQEIFDIINQTHSSDVYHKFSPIHGFPVATDGVIALAEAAGCFWFLDVIGSYQTDKRLDTSFQVWKLEVNLEECSAIARGFNDTELIITQEIPCQLRIRDFRRTYPIFDSWRRNLLSLAFSDIGKPPFFQGCLPYLTTVQRNSSP